MGTFAVGDILLIRFPFSDLKQTKIRPVLLIGLSDFNNLVVCQITSKAPNSATALQISDNDLVGESGLHTVSFVRANKIFTAAPELVAKKLGSLDHNTRQNIHKLLLKTFEDLGK